MQCVEVSKQVMTISVNKLQFLKQSPGARGPRWKPFLLFNFRSAVNELVGPELVYGVLDKLDESNKETPWVWPVDDEPLQ